MTNSAVLNKGPRSHYCYHPGTTKYFENADVEENLSLGVVYVCKFSVAVLINKQREIFTTKHRNVVPSSVNALLGNTSLAAK